MPRLPNACRITAVATSGFRSDRMILNSDRWRLVLRSNSNEWANCTASVARASGWSPCPVSPRVKEYWYTGDFGTLFISSSNKDMFVHPFGIHYPARYRQEHQSTMSQNCDMAAFIQLTSRPTSVCDR